VASVEEQLKFARKAGDLESRALDEDEKRIARRVFQDTLKLSHVDLAAGLGAQDRMWTEPNWEARIYTLGFYQAHVIHVGPEGFVLGMQSSPDRQKALVHELTHVWQAQVEDGYLLAAGWHQLFDDDPYRFTPGEPWERYSVEQQAQIVETWYGRGAVEDASDDLFPYIRDVIRSPPQTLPLGFRFHPYHR
jgi:hypothetical protein